MPKAARKQSAKRRAQGVTERQRAEGNGQRAVKDTTEDRGLKMEDRNTKGEINRRFSRQDAKTAKKNIFLFSLNLAPFAPLQLAPWNNAVNEKITVPWTGYSTGLAPWNTDSTEIQSSARSAIPQGESLLSAMRDAVR